MTQRSIRTRIALWYSAVFFTFVGVLGAASYSFLAYTSQERVDEFLAESGATIASTIEFERKAGAADTVAMRTVVASMRLPDVAVHVFDQTTGRALSSYEGLRFRRTTVVELEESLADSLAGAARAAASTPELATFIVAGQSVRVLTLPYALGRRPLVIAVGQVMTARTRMLADARWALGLGLPLVLACATLGGWLLAGKSLAPVDNMATRARELGATNLHERLPIANPNDELGRLASAFNDLLGRLEEAFEAQSRFAADASHELRTPVAVISGETQLALSRTRTREELLETIGVIRDQGQRLRSIVDDLFFLARADAGERVVQPRPLHLRDLVDDSVLALRTLAASREVSLHPSGHEQALIDGDETLLRRAIENVLVNAIKYGGTGGSVYIEVRDAGNWWWLDVRDTGPGIAPDQQARLFERFFRAENARTSAGVEGAGLGLAITRWVARAHGGDALLAATSNTGSTFRLMLPKRR